MNIRAFLGDRVFLASLVLVLVTGAGVPALVAGLAERFGKQAIDPRLTLHAFDTGALPSFRHVPSVRVIGSGPEWVGTEEMFSLAFEPREWDAAQGDRPTLVLFVTYYSDPDDTIPHTPEVCYRQAGGEVRRMITTSVDIPGREDTPVRAYALDIGVGDQDYSVVYFFYHNGRIVHDRERLRFIMSMPGDRYTYFSKVETATIRSPAMSFEDSIAPLVGLISEAVTELAAHHFPRDEDVRR